METVPTALTFGVVLGGEESSDQSQISSYAAVSADCVSSSDASSRTVDGRTPPTAKSSVTKTPHEILMAGKDDNLVRVSLSKGARSSWGLLLSME
jgi:hypothetical protein